MESMEGQTLACSDRVALSVSWRGPFRGLRDKYPIGFWRSE